MSDVALMKCQSWRQRSLYAEKFGSVRKSHFFLVENRGTPWELEALSVTGIINTALKYNLSQDIAPNSTP